MATPVYAPLAVYEGSSFLTSSPASVIFGSLFGDSHSDRFFKFPKDCKSNFFVHVLNSTAAAAAAAAKSRQLCLTL